MNLFSAAERLVAMDRLTVTLDVERCLHTRDCSVGCQACFGICSLNAILPGKPPAFNAEKCKTCLACLVVCPTGAFVAEDAVPSLLTAVSHLERVTLELLCEKNPQPERGTSETSLGIRIRGCLAGLGTGAYVALAAFDLEGVFIRTENCASCEYATLGSEIEMQVMRAKRILKVWAKDETFACVALLDKGFERSFWNANNPPLSRRDLFRMLACQGQVAMARAIGDEQSKDRHRPGRDRLRLLGAVRHLPSRESVPDFVLDELGFAMVAVLDSCSACGACARACPTNALIFEKDEGGTTYTLKFSPSNCIGCEICIHVCAASALTVGHNPTFAQVFDQEIVILREGKLSRCQRCGALFAAQPDVQLCTLCGLRRGHPFGLVQPPGSKGSKPLAADNDGGQH